MLAEALNIALSLRGDNIIGLYMEKSENSQLNSVPIEQQDRFHCINHEVKFSSIIPTITASDISASWYSEDE